MICPECEDGMLVPREGGCEACDNCGWSRCQMGDRP